MKKLLLLFVFCSTGIVAQTCGSLVANPLTGQFDCVGSSSSSTTATVATGNTATPNCTATGGAGTVGCSATTNLSGVATVTIVWNGNNTSPTYTCWDTSVSPNVGCGGLGSTASIQKAELIDANTVKFTFSADIAYRIQVNAGNSQGKPGTTGAQGPTGPAGAAGAGNNAYCADSNAADTAIYACASPSPNVTTLSGLLVTFTPTTTNTSCAAHCSLNVAGLGPKNLFQADGATDLATGALLGGQAYNFAYDGNNFRQVSSSGSASAAGTQNTVQKAGAAGVFAASGITDDGTTVTTTEKVNLSGSPTTDGLKIPGGAGAAPTADDTIAFNTTPHNLTIGLNGLNGVVPATLTATGCLYVSPSQAGDAAQMAATDAGPYNGLTPGITIANTTSDFLYPATVCNIPANWFIKLKALRVTVGFRATTPASTPNFSITLKWCSDTSCATSPVDVWRIATMGTIGTALTNVQYGAMWILTAADVVGASAHIIAIPTAQTFFANPRNFDFRSLANTVDTSQSRYLAMTIKVSATTAGNMFQLIYWSVEPVY